MEGSGIGRYMTRERGVGVGPGASAPGGTPWGRGWLSPGVCGCCAGGVKVDAPRTAAAAGAGPVPLRLRNAGSRVRHGLCGAALTCSGRPPTPAGPSAAARSGRPRVDRRSPLDRVPSGPGSRAGRTINYSTPTWQLCHFRRITDRSIRLAVKMTFGAQGLSRTFTNGWLGHDPVEIRNVVVRRDTSRPGSVHVGSGRAGAAMCVSHGARVSGEAARVVMEGAGGV